MSRESAPASVSASNERKLAIVESNEPGGGDSQTTSVIKEGSRLSFLPDQKSSQVGLIGGQASFTEGLKISFDEDMVAQNTTSNNSWPDDLNVGGSGRCETDFFCVGQQVPDSGNESTETSGSADESSDSSSEESYPSIIHSKDISGSVLSDLSLGVDALRSEANHVEGKFKEVEETGNEPMDPENEAGNLFVVPKRRRTSYALLDDPAYEIDYGDSKFDDLSGKWGDRKEKYEALYENTTVTNLQPTDVSGPDGPEQPSEMQGDEKPKAQKALFWPVNVFGLRFAGRRASPEDEKIVANLEESQPQSRGDKDRQRNRKRLRNTHRIVAEIPAFNEQLKTETGKNGAMATAIFMSTATYDTEKQETSATFARRAIALRGNGRVNSGLNFFVGSQDQSFKDKQDLLPEFTDEATDLASGFTKKPTGSVELLVTGAEMKGVNVYSGRSGLDCMEEERETKGVNVHSWRDGWEVMEKLSERSQGTVKSGHLQSKSQPIALPDLLESRQITGHRSGGTSMNGRHQDLEINEDPENRVSIAASSSSSTDEHELMPMSMASMKHDIEEGSIRQTEGQKPNVEEDSVAGDIDSRFVFAEEGKPDAANGELGSRTQMHGSDHEGSVVQSSELIQSTDSVAGSIATTCEDGELLVGWGDDPGTATENRVSIAASSSSSTDEHELMPMSMASMKHDIEEGSIRQTEGQKPNVEEDSVAGDIDSRFVFAEEGKPDAANGELGSRTQMHGSDHEGSVVQSSELIQSTDSVAGSIATTCEDGELLVGWGDDPGTATDSYSTLGDNRDSFANETTEYEIEDKSAEFEESIMFAYAAYGPPIESSFSDKQDSVHLISVRGEVDSQEMEGDAASETDATSDVGIVANATSIQQLVTEEEMFQSLHGDSDDEELSIVDDIDSQRDEGEATDISLSESVNRDFLLATGNGGSSASLLEDGALIDGVLDDVRLDALDQVEEEDDHVNTMANLVVGPGDRSNGEECFDDIEAGEFEDTHADEANRGSTNEKQSGVGQAMMMAARIFGRRDEELDSKKCEEKVADMGSPEVIDEEDFIDLNNLEDLDMMEEDEGPEELDEDDYHAIMMATQVFGKGFRKEASNKSGEMDDVVEAGEVDGDLAEQEDDGNVRSSVGGQAITMAARLFGIKLEVQDTSNGGVGILGSPPDTAEMGQSGDGLDGESMELDNHGEEGINSDSKEIDLVSRASSSQGSQSGLFVDFPNRYAESSSSSILQQETKLCKPTPPDKLTHDELARTSEGGVLMAETTLLPKGEPAVEFLEQKVPVMSPYLDLEVPGDLSDDETRASSKPPENAAFGDEENQILAAAKSADEVPFNRKKKVRIMEAENPSDSKAQNPASDSDTQRGSSSSTGSYSDSYSGSSFSGSYSGSDSSRSYTSTSGSNSGSGYNDTYSGDSFGVSGSNSDKLAADVENQLHHDANNEKNANQSSLFVDPNLTVSNAEACAGGNYSEEQHAREAQPAKRFTLDGIVSMMRNEPNDRKTLLPFGPDVELGSSSDDDEGTPTENNRSLMGNKYIPVKAAVDSFSDEHDEEDPPVQGEKKSVCDSPWLSGWRLWTLVIVALLLILSIILGATLSGGNAPGATNPTPAPTLPTTAPTLAFESKDWTQLGDAFEGVDLRDQAGFSVSLSQDGNTVAVGARRSSADGLVNRGNVKIYRFEFNRWYLIGDLQGHEARNQFGFSVSISENGSRLAVGSVGDDGNGENSGMVEVFEFQGGSWAQIGQFRGRSEGDIFGASVSLSADGRLVAIGAPYRAASVSRSRAGEVYFYEVSDNGSFLHGGIGN